MTEPHRPLALITGASSGIGYAFAKLCAEEGYDLLVVSGTNDIRRAATELEAMGTACEPLQVDLATREGVEEVGRTIEKMNRPVELCAINAGIGANGDFVRETSLEDNFRVIDLNITSTVHLTKLVLEGMVRRNSGKVLLTSSVAGVMPGPYEAVYAASKAFVYSFGEAIRNELRDTDITVTVLMPGPTDTKFFDRAKMTDTKIATSKKDSPDEVARDGYKALMSDRDHVVTGSMRNKLYAIGAKIAPIEQVTKQHASFSRPGSGRSG